MDCAVATETPLIDMLCPLKLAAFLPGGLLSFRAEFLSSVGVAFTVLPIRQELVLPMGSYFEPLVSSECAVLRKSEGRD